MFSTGSELAPRAPIPDGRMERIMQPWVLILPNIWCFDLQTLYNRVYDVSEDLSVWVKCHVRHGIPWSIGRKAYCVALSVSEWEGHWRFDFSVFCALLLNETQKTFIAIPCNVLVNYITFCIPDICHKHHNRWLQGKLIFFINADYGILIFLY